LAHQDIGREKPISHLKILERIERNCGIGERELNKVRSNDEVRFCEDFISC